MESRYKLLGHPIHPMLVPYPLALLTTATVFDLIGVVSGDGTWHTLAYWMIAAGILMGALAAVFGLLDYTHIATGTRAKRVGLLHGGGNALLMVIFVLSFALRIGHVSDPGLIPFVLAVVGSALGTVTAWLGGELPYRLGIGIDPGANPNASNSLTRDPIRVGE